MVCQTTGRKYTRLWAFLIVHKLRRIHIVLWTLVCFVKKSFHPVSPFHKYLLKWKNDDHLKCALNNKTHSWLIAPEILEVQAAAALGGASADGALKCVRVGDSRFYLLYTHLHTILVVFRIIFGVTARIFCPDLLGQSCLLKQRTERDVICSITQYLFIDDVLKLYFSLFCCQSCHLNLSWSNFMIWSKIKSKFTFLCSSWRFESYTCWCVNPIYFQPWMEILNICCCISVRREKIISSEISLKIENQIYSCNNICDTTFS